MEKKRIEGFKEFILEQDGAIAYFTINRPQARNALNERCFIEISQFVDYLEDTPEVRTAIITGAGEKAFIAGADINGVRTKTGIRHLRKPDLENALRKLELCTKPVIAAVNGYAFGGGFELALACDIRIASENARFGLPETNLGIYPGAGGTQRLARMAGIGVAKEVIMAGRTLKPEEAKALGLVMQVVPLGSLMDEAEAIAQKMMEKGPVALTVAKKVITASMDTDISTGMLLESLGYALLLESKDKQEGTAAFLEKRAPVFCGE